jgi:hypothetical protein
MKKAGKKRAAKGKRKLPPLPTSKAKGGVLPGVNLDSNSELLDRMEGRERPKRA